MSRTLVEVVQLLPSLQNRIRWLWLWRWLYVSFALL